MPLPRIEEIQRDCARFGTPIIRFVVTSEGKTARHKYLRSTGCSRADQALLGWFKKWLYLPATRKGKPVAKTITVVVNWNSADVEKD